MEFILFAALVPLAVTVHQADRTVVLVPPVLDGEVTLAPSQEVKDAWALFVAELLGNVTPRNAEVLTKALDPLLAPALRQDVLRVLDSQISEIKREKISLSFQPRSISRDAGTDTLYVKECFVIVGGFGDLGAERAYLRSETLTCVRTDGGVIEVPIDGYAVGEDGKVGIRGRLVSKQGAMLARAMQAGFLQSFSKVFTQVPSIPISTSGSQVQFQSMLTPQSAQAGIAGGVGGAMEKLADYYMTMAGNTFPVLEVDAGRGIEIILNKGVSLRLAQ